jgi:hypothetical protein
MDWNGEERRKDAPNERVAVLENEVRALKVELDDMQTKLDMILAEITRYRGFLGGIMFIISGVGLAWQIFGEHLKKWLV